jgi:hypothetical protein
LQASQELEGCLSVSQVERLMTIIDTDHDGTIDFHELAKGLQKIDLRVEVSAPHWYPLGPPPSDCLPLMAFPLIERRCTSICSW